MAECIRPAMPHTDDDANDVCDVCGEEMIWYIEGNKLHVTGRLTELPTDVVYSEIAVVHDGELALPEGTEVGVDVSNSGTISGAKFRSAAVVNNSGTIETVVHKVNGEDKVLAYIDPLPRWAIPARAWRGTQAMSLWPTMRLFR